MKTTDCPHRRRRSATLSILSSFHRQGPSDAASTGRRHDPPGSPYRYLHHRLIELRRHACMESDAGQASPEQCPGRSTKQPGVRTRHRSQPGSDHHRLPIPGRSSVRSRRLAIRLDHRPCQIQHFSGIRAHGWPTIACRVRAPRTHHQRHIRALPYSVPTGRERHGQQYYAHIVRSSRPSWAHGDRGQFRSHSGRSTCSLSV